VTSPDEDLGAGEVVQPAGVVGVQVGQHDPVDVGRRDPEPRQLGPDLLLGRDLQAQPVAVVGMPAREVAGLHAAGGLAGVDDDDAFGMLDREGVDRQRLGPPPIHEHVQLATRSVAAGLHLAGLDRHRPGLDRVDLHRGRVPDPAPAASRSRRPDALG
jgi:hypothetical protein